jgi:acetyl-CoA synthetase
VSPDNPEAGGDRRPDEIAALLKEARLFEPTESWRANATANDPGVYERAAADPEAFWAGFAGELEWTRPWTEVLDWQPPHARWFVGGQLNASVNCLDRHIRTSRRNTAALIWEGEPGDRRTLTYWDLYTQVCQCANVLKSLGVAKGDRVAIYLPLIPELAIAMLACARIGAVHSVVFGGLTCGRTSLAMANKGAPREGCMRGKEERGRREGRKEGTQGRRKEGRKRRGSDVSG